MQQPYLRIFAGCNGAGKSTYSKILSTDALPFDFDKRFLEKYNSMPDSELREEIAKNIISEEFLSEFNHSLLQRKTFSFETNLFPFPSEMIHKAKEKGFRLEMYFFCLTTIELAKERVAIRANNHGHYVDDYTVQMKWKEGYKNINMHFSEFDYLVFIDNSLDKNPTPLFELSKSSGQSFDLTQYVDELPEYTERRLPAIFGLLKNNR